VNTNPKLKIGDRYFRDLDSYNLAKKDYSNIENIKRTLDMTDISGVLSVLERINKGEIVFHSLLGQDFVEELEEHVKKLEKQSQSLRGTKFKEDKNYIQFKKDKKNSKFKDKKIGINNKDEIIVSDDLLEKEIHKELVKQERKRLIYLFIFGSIALACIGYLIFYSFMYSKNTAEYEELSELIDNTRPTKKEYKINLVDETREELPVLGKYELLYQKNQKIVGWIKIDGTKIDYPVMQTVNNEYYLDHNYNQQYDKNGSIFMDKDCDAMYPGDNLIIYGHNMKSGKMFGNLNYYSKESFYKKHPYILFDTIYETGTYEIMYVFRSKIYSEEEIVFKYYKFIDAVSEEEFNSNLKAMKELSLYDTGVTASYGDKLITLSTCDYEEKNGRFVVVAKKIE